MSSKLRVLAAFAVLLTLGACTTLQQRSAELPAPPVHPNGQVLWGLVHDRCVPGQRSGAGPAPCGAVVLSPDEAHGYAVLKDRVGVGQHLVMPTTRITGIEDPQVLAPGATNYFAAAWLARPWLFSRLPNPLPREEVSIAVNSPYGRSQDLLHLHVDCVSPETQAALLAHRGDIGPAWSRSPLTLEGHAYLARWLDGEDLAQNPFQLLAQGVPGARSQMAAWSLVLIGAQGADGRAGFILLATRADPAHGLSGSGEELQDHDCRVLQPS